MAGLLCGPGKERILSGTVQKLLCPLRRENPAAFIVFSLPNVNLKDKTVYGNLVSTDGILPVKTAVPPLIFNFSVQHSAADIKKLRGLLEIENLAAVNPANRMDQLALMEMLAVSKENAGILLPCREAAAGQLSELRQFILRPEHSSGLSRVIYAEREGDGYCLYNWQGNSVSHLYEIERALRPVFESGKWILMESPRLQIKGDRLFVMRSYLQRRYNGEWEVVMQTGIQRNERLFPKGTGTKCESQLLDIARNIHCFIPNLGFCYIDFVFTPGRTPYFLGLGGWQNCLTGRRTGRSVRQKLCGNIAECSRLV